MHSAHKHADKHCWRERMMVKHAHTVPKAKYTLTPSVLNPATMHRIIVCVKGPMAHIYLLKMVVHTLTDPSVATRGQCLWAFRASLLGTLSIFWLLNHLSWPLFWREIKCQILQKAANVLHHQQSIAEETASWLEAWRRAVTSPTIISDQYIFVSNCILWCIPARCTHLRTYPIFPSSSTKSESKKATFT